MSWFLLSHCTAIGLVQRTERQGPVQRTVYFTSRNHGTGGRQGGGKRGGNGLIGMSGENYGEEPLSELFA